MEERVGGEARPLWKIVSGRTPWHLFPDFKREHPCSHRFGRIEPQRHYGSAP